MASHRMRMAALWEELEWRKKSLMEKEINLTPAPLIYGDVLGRTYNKEDGGRLYGPRSRNNNGWIEWNVGVDKTGS